jgi:hypothetical protein
VEDLEVVRSRLQRCENEVRHLQQERDDIAQDQELAEKRFLQEIAVIQAEAQRTTQQHRTTARAETDRMREQLEAAETRLREETAASRTAQDAAAARARTLESDLAALRKLTDERDEAHKVEAAALREEARRATRSLEEMQVQQEQALRDIRTQWREDTRAANERETELLRQHMAKQMDLNQKVKTAQIQNARAEAQVEEHKRHIEDLQTRQQDKRARFDFETIKIRAAQVDKENEHLKSTQRQLEDELRRTQLSNRDLDKRLKDTEHKLKIELAKSSVTE